MLNCLLVGVGGFAGAVCRYLIGLLPFAAGGFPIKTLIINVLGSFAIGLIVALFEKNAFFTPQVLLMLKVGVCGGFTTFSGFALESAGLLQSGSLLMAIAFVLASVVLGVLAIYAAGWIVR